jgi:hypothetical protein
VATRQLIFMTGPFTALPPLRTSRRLKRHRAQIASAMAILATIAIIAPSLGAEDPQITTRRTHERKTFTDAEITDGFFKIALGAEYQLAGRVDRIRKYEAPVRVFIDNRAKPDRRSEVAAVVADIRARIKHLDIAVTGDPASANVVVTMVKDRDLSRTIREFYGRERGRRIQRSLEPQCLSGFRKDDSYRITHSDVLLVVDAGDFIFFDCVYEELLQALGPINDNETVPWTMFNDDVQMGFFDRYDQYLLNILYDPRVKPGMTRDEVHAVLPEVLPTVRAFVERNNGAEK